MHNKKALWLRILKITAVLIPAILLVLYMPVNDFDDATRIKNFYLEEPDSLDMVLIGSSENYAGYSPVLAYEEYGFTSYPYTISANASILFEAQLEEVLRVQSPQVIVVDIGEMVNNRDDSYDTMLRQFVAGIPFSRHKVEIIQQYGDSEDVLSYYFPFIVNHGKADFGTMLDYIKTNAAIQKRGYSLLKGTLTFTGSGENWDGPYVTPIDTAGDYSTADLTPELNSAVQRMITACKKHPEVTFLFINTPHRIVGEERYRNYQMTNTIGGILEENGYKFCNLESMTDQIGIIPETDFYNNHHMNLYGQYKVTRALCEVLINECGLEKRQLSPAVQEQWDTCVAYRPLYFSLFEEKFKAREPGEFGMWLQENHWLLTTLEEMKQI